MNNNPIKIVFIGYNALGDTLCTTPVVRSFRECNPDSFITYIVQDVEYCRVLEANPDIDLIIYNELMYAHGLSVYSEKWIQMLPLDITEPTPLLHFDIHKVATLSNVFEDHISYGFARLLDIPISSSKPIVKVTQRDRERANAFKRSPYIVFSMHSYTNPTRQIGGGGMKDWPRENWWQLAEFIHKQYNLDVVAVGSERDAQEQSPYIRNLYGLPIMTVAALLQDAVCMITLENGLAHLAAAVDVPMVQIYSPIVPKNWAYPMEASFCHAIYKAPETVTFQEVIDALQLALKEREVAVL